MNLTIDELDVLMEAMEAWERNDVIEEIADTIILPALKGGGDPKFDEELEAMAEERAQRRAENTKRRKECSVLIRAKLIRAKNALLAEQVDIGGKEFISA